MKPAGISPVSTAALVACHGAAAVVAEDHDQRHPEHADAVLEGAQDGVVDDLAGGADHEDVAEAQVEDDFGGEPGVRAAEDDGERVLVLHQGGPAARRPGWGAEDSPATKRSLPSRRRRQARAGVR